MKNIENSKDSDSIDRQWSFLTFGLAQLFVIMGVLTVLLRLWSVDLSVPFSYWSDTVWFTVPIKGMVDNGWVYTIPQLSAPFTLSAAAFPSMTHTDWLVMKVISLFAADPGVILNTFWFCSVVFAAWSTMLALSLLGVKAWLAAVLGVIYAFLPFALLRNVLHISLVYYCVPLLSLLAIWIAMGCPSAMSKFIRWTGYFAVVAQGFNYIYYSFFALLLFAFAGWFGSVQMRSWRPLKEASLAAIVILFVASINLAPSFLSWYAHGKPPDMAYKSTAEAEIYGLKIRKMLAPSEANKIPGLNIWGQRDKSVPFPNENENTTARLGPMAAAGLLFSFLVVLGLVRVRDELGAEAIKSVAALILFAVLFATVGGLGAVFNLMFSEFRTYNRLSVFVAFFSLAAIAFWWQSRYKNAASFRERGMLGFGLVCLVGVSLYDQLLDLRHLQYQRPEQEIQTEQLRAVVNKIEDIIPPGSSVFQLPITGFPLDSGRARMGTYDHGQAYFVSRSLHWSWPSFSRRHRAWQDQLIGLEGSQLAEALALSKFRLVWVDRFGYPDNGEKIISSLVDAGAEELLPGTHSRYVILDLHHVIARLKEKLGVEEFEQRQREYLDAPSLDVGGGFYPLEHTPEGRPFHWSRKQSELVVTNPSEKSRSFELSFLVAAGKPGAVVVTAGSQKVSTVVTSVPARAIFPLNLAQGEKLVIRFNGDMGRIDLPSGETRDLHFYIMDMKLRASPYSGIKLGEKRGS